MCCCYGIVPVLWLNILFLQIQKALVGTFTELNRTCTGLYHSELLYVALKTLQYIDWSGNRDSFISRSTCISCMWGRNRIAVKIRCKVTIWVYLIYFHMLITCYWNPNMFQSNQMTIFTEYTTLKKMPNLYV